MQERRLQVLSPSGDHHIEGARNIDRITNVLSLSYLYKIAKEKWPKDPRVVKGIEIIKQFMKDYGYID